MPTALGPTLPELLRDRRGIPSRTTTLVFLTLVVLIGGAVLVIKHLRQPAPLVHHGAPTFTLVSRGPVHKAALRDGELARLVARRPRGGWEPDGRALRPAA